MKRNILLVLGACALLLSGCSSMPADSDELYFEEVVEFPEMTKDHLYELANLWAVQTFNKADSVIEYANPETGSISGKFVYTTNLYYGVYTVPLARCVFSINIKDDKVRLSITFSEVCVQTGYTIIWREPFKSEFKQTKFPEQCERISANLKEFISSYDSQW